MELHFLELPKFVKGVQKPIREMTKMERWMAYFANRMNQSEKEELAMSEAAINNAYDATGIFLQDKAERLKYINREMALMDYRSGMMSAEERGEKRGEKRGEERGEKRADERYSRLRQLSNEKRQVLAVQSRRLTFLVSNHKRSKRKGRRTIVQRPAFSYMVETKGFEPSTPRLRTWCSPS